ncbi:hypothetical protein Tco_1503009 [Tanacetum coccineum]
MIGVLRKLAEHSLGLNKYATPIRQKRCSLSLERSQDMDYQITDLIKAGILRPVQYQTWVANPVLFKKSNDKEFKDQIGVNLEAYVDDTVIKSKTEDALLHDIIETF